MKRQVLTTNSNGVREDLIPYVDDLAVAVGKSNLKEVLENITSQIKANNLFKGAFESENVLLAIYPNGTNLDQGTYAIVTDVDAIYLYDVETLTWKRTATSGLSISQINGLTSTNGSLTLTGGDILANVPNADVDEQSVTNHLNNLYGKTNDITTLSYGTVAVGGNYPSTTIENDYVVFKTDLANEYKNARFLFLTLREPKSITAEEISDYVKIRINYLDGTSKTVLLLSADGSIVRYSDLKNAIGLYSVNTEVDVFLKIGDEYAVIPYFSKNGPAKNVSDTYTIYENKWVDNEEGTGYKCVITAEESKYTSSYVVLNVYKNKNGMKTTAIVDYTTQNNIITIYSDEKFGGGVTVQYAVE